MAAGTIGAFVLVTLIFGERIQPIFASASAALLKNLGWMYIGGISLALIFLIGIFASSYGRMRLGDDDDDPEHSLPVWFAMLFAGGVGAVLMFWGVAEPINHIYNPPMNNVEPMSAAAAEQAFAFTFYHFGIHMWVIMALPGLALGYFIYKRKLPPRLSSIFAPLLGPRIYSLPGKFIDALAIIGTVFGIAVSVGLGTLQVNAGLNKIWGVPLVGWVELLIIILITVVASFSVASGLDKGIKILSNLNIAMAVIFMVFVVLTGPTLTLLRSVVEAFGIYGDWLPRLMFWTDSYSDNPGWQGKWTAFYWAWTICWSPFTGMFVARISRGRTVREFIGGVLILPTIFGVIWFAIFGRAGLEIERAQPGFLTVPVVEQGDVSAALFNFLQAYPLSSVVSVFALMIVIIFFITSIDSSAMVNDMMCTGEENQSPTAYRIAWAVMIGAVAAVLLIVSPGTGIDVLQQVVIIVALPFFLMQFVMMYSLLKGMNDDRAAMAPLVTRRWEKTDTAEKLATHEQQPAPGFDEDGNILPTPEFEQTADGTVIISGNVMIDGELGITGSVNDDVEKDDIDKERDQGKSSQ
ncbi:BCCT family transporter [Corynebacterium sp. ES2794-CONJ1]|nr:MULTISPECIES: BCCT family transporter [unclassified Corynebacterium]MCS4490528.1 BCCT family transporter [Corynebacterium sp. ES2775-CONJ]MCS4492307.1 BCCT family transporter [Corynebacterium sp. ES2715-CONJ3]MCS4532501.1 BCCT family transporter [Corynebacterium sp. ES2730-CONJ]MCU9519896.1 BCCT family transporter [Corynebacterium sp. ES2794-CONJ1]